MSRSLEGLVINTSSTGLNLRFQISKQSPELQLFIYLKVIYLILSVVAHVWRVQVPEGGIMNLPVERFNLCWNHSYYHLKTRPFILDYNKQEHPICSTHLLPSSNRRLQFRGKQPPAKQPLIPNSLICLYVFLFFFLRKNKWRPEVILHIFTLGQRPELLFFPLMSRICNSGPKKLVPRNRCSLMNHVQAKQPLWPVGTVPVGLFTLRGKPRARVRDDLITLGKQRVCMCFLALIL